MRLQLVTVPYRYDEREEGLGAGPGALLAAGLVDRLRAAGQTVSEPRAATLPPNQSEANRTAVNIGRLGAQTASLVATARAAGEGALILAGDDTAAIGVVAGVQQADGAATPIGVVWLDAHGDFNTPETSVSGILAGMPLAILAGLAGPLWRVAAGLAAPIATDRILLAGVRDLDPQEAELLRRTTVRLIPSEQLGDDDIFADAVEQLARRCTLLCLHVDLDLLDPRFVPSASTPAADGPTVEEAAAAIATVLRTDRVATFCLTSLNPGAGRRGERSVASALALLEQALPAWNRCPAPPAASHHTGRR